MSEIQTIEALLDRAVGRKRWERALAGLWHGLLVGSSVWLAALVTYKLVPVPAGTLWSAAGLGLGLIVFGFGAGWFRKPSRLEMARWVDAKEGLKERVSTAVEMSSKGVMGRWSDLVVSDAARVVSGLDWRRLWPLHLPQATRWALLVLILAAGLGFIPEYRTKAYLQKAREAEVIRESGKQLAELTRRNLEQRPPVMARTQKALESVAELGEKLSQVKMTRADALKDLASVTEKVKEQARELAKNPALRKMERAARMPGGSGAPAVAEVQKQMDALQKALGDKSPDATAVDKLKKDLEKAKEAAAGLHKNASGSGDTGKEELAKALAELSERAQAMGLTLPNLDEAIAALAESKTDEVLKDLEFAEHDLEKLQEMARQLQNLKWELAALGKDLGEQLEKGQVQAAQSTMRKMIETLKSAQVKPEEISKLMEEVSRAVGPAGEYGKVAELLKEAVDQMKRDDRGGAAQSLAEAVKELDKLLEQLGDCQGLMASLRALQKAQMCVGNCQGWSRNQGPPKAGRKGGLGSGVGMWADDSAMLDLEEIKQEWDNSGVERPDVEARGLTDRGEGQAPDNVSPSKVKGKINPGGPMPSITLKGVSIKGMSRVQFQEMAVSAQSEAQSALSQDQVPRAYQGAVRDYFDDLK